MKIRRLIASVLAALMCIGTLPAYVSAEEGSGTKEDPYRISSYDDLEQFRSVHRYIDYAVLTADIDASESAKDGNEFPGIGDETHPFSGDFDGRGHVITGLHVLGSQNAGLFGYVGSGGKVRNLGLEGGSLEGDDNVGSLIGVNFGTLENCYNAGSVLGNNNVGGLIGVNYGTVKNCYNTGDVQTDGSGTIGGLIGIQREGDVRCCYNSGSVISDTPSGVIGSLSGGNVSYLYYDRAWAPFDAIGENTGGVATDVKALDTADMAGLDALGEYSELKGFDTDHWLANDGYPLLMAFCPKVTFHANDGPSEIPFRHKVKRYKRLQILVKNDAVNEGFGVYAIVKHFAAGGFAR